MSHICGNGVSNPDGSTPLPVFTFPNTRATIFSPPDCMVWMEKLPAVSRVKLRNGQQAWLVRGYWEAKEILQSADVSSDPTRDGAPVVTGPPGTYRKAPGFFVDADPPEHARLRRSLVGEFGLGALRSMEPLIESRACELAAALSVRAGGPVDLVRDYALPLAASTICGLLGAPLADQEFFVRARKIMVNVSAPKELRDEAFDEMKSYLGALVDERRRNGPTASYDLVGRAVAGPLADGDITLEELNGMVMLLLFTGFETTANMIALGAASLLYRPEVRRHLLLEQGDWQVAVEEFLRYFSTAALEMAGRTATSEMVLGDACISPGDGIVIHPWSVNHDPRVFPSPDEIIVDRHGPRHLAFGMGRHQCLGQSIVRSQMSIGLRLLFERYPEMKPSLPVDRLAQSPNSAAFGLSELWVSPSAAPSESVK